jgi:hypothetical protein
MLSTHVSAPKKSSMVLNGFCKGYETKIIYTVEPIDDYCPQVYAIAYCHVHVVCFLN